MHCYRILRLTFNLFAVHLLLLLLQLLLYLGVFVHQLIQLLAYLLLETNHHLLIRPRIIAAMVLTSQRHCKLVSLFLNNSISNHYRLIVFLLYPTTTSAPISALSMLLSIFRLIHVSIVSFGHIAQHEVAGRSTAHTLLQIGETIIFFLFSLLYLLTCTLLKESLSQSLSLKVVVILFFYFFGLCKARYLRQFPPLRTIGQRSPFQYCFFCAIVEAVTIFTNKLLFLATLRSLRIFHCYLFILRFSLAHKAVILFEDEICNILDVLIHSLLLIDDSCIYQLESRSYLVGLFGVECGFDGVCDHFQPRLQLTDDIVLVGLFDVGYLFADEESVLFEFLAVYRVRVGYILAELREQFCHLNRILYRIRLFPTNKSILIIAPMLIKQVYLLSELDSNKRGNIFSQYYCYMNKHAKNFYFINHHPPQPAHHKLLEIRPIDVKISRQLQRIIEPMSQDRYIEEAISRNNQIVVGNSLKLIQPQTMAPKVHNPLKQSALYNSNNNKTVLQLSAINTHKRANSLFQPNNSVIQKEESSSRLKTEAAKKCKEMRFITDLSPYQNKITKNFTSSKRKGISVRLQEAKPSLIKKQLLVLLFGSDQLRSVKSQSYLVMQYPSKKIIRSKKSRVKMEIASLTKIMTFYVILQIIRTWSIDPQEQKIIVGLTSTRICGTSALLEAGEEYSIESLLYGMMLPSGNDAASELAIWGGHYLTSNTKRKAKIYAFVQQMNRYSIKLGLSSTNFSNPHGLTHSEALSTTKDIAILCCACLESQLFKSVVSCKRYTCSVKSEQRQRVVSWRNTNKLLNVAGFVGLKTGTTTSAGPCLASAYQFRNKIYITVVLKARKSIGRFKQTCEILAYSLQRLYTDMDESEKGRLQALKQAYSQIVEQTVSEYSQTPQTKQLSKSQVNRAITVQQ